ncbi:hypothetical protein PBS_44150 [Paraburkholderia sp. 2C]
MVNAEPLQIVVDVAHIGVGGIHIGQVDADTERVDKRVGRHRPHRIARVRRRCACECGKQNSGGCYGMLHGVFLAWESCRFRATRSVPASRWQSLHERGIGKPF